MSKWPIGPTRQSDFQYSLVTRRIGQPSDRPLLPFSTIVIREPGQNVTAASPSLLYTRKYKESCWHGRGSNSHTRHESRTLYPFGHATLGLCLKVHSERKLNSKIIC